MVHNQPEDDRKEHNLEDGHEHRPEVDINRLAGIDQSQERSHERREQCGHRGHGDGKRHIAVAQVSHDIGGSAAGAGADEDDADGQLRRQVEDLAKQEGKERHQGELTDRAEHHILRSLEYLGKIRGLQGETHAEHDDAEQPVDPARLDPGAGLRREEREGSHTENDERHPLPDKIADFFQCFHAFAFLPQASAACLGYDKAELRNRQKASVSSRNPIRFREETEALPYFLCGTTLPCCRLTATATQPHPAMRDL